jgi:DNA repair protein RecO (recombination protein O)
MLQKTGGIVLRAIKYGDTSLICSIFTAVYGVQSYMVRGVRTTKVRTNRAMLLQPATLLDMVTDHKSLRGLQNIREFQPAHIYHSLQGEIVKNSIALFTVEVLLRLLPEAAPMPELYDMAYTYFVHLDALPVREVANFPLYFIIQCSRLLGYDIKGGYTEDTPYLSLQEGGYTHQPPMMEPFAAGEDARLLDKLLNTEHITALRDIEMNAATRYRLLDWYMEYLHLHTQHLGNIKSLAVLREILHN